MSNSEKTLEQLSRELDQANNEKERADENARRLLEESRAREETVRREKESREEAFRSLKIIEKKFVEGEGEISRLQQARAALGRDIEEKERLIAESRNSNTYLNVTLGEMKENERLMMVRIEELNKVNVENKATFERNYQTLKAEIAYREKANEDKAKRIDLLQYQASEDSKRVLAINPTRVVEGGRYN